MHFVACFAQEGMFLMSGLLTLENLANLGVLIFLQAVLGFDNLLYISIESQRAPEDKQQSLRRIGILIAIALRIGLLLLVVRLVRTFEDPLFHLRWPGVIEGGFNFASLVFLLGGGFIMYTALKEIGHMMSLEDLSDPNRKADTKPSWQVVTMIVLMNLVFSFDSILSALAITDVVAVLSVAVVVSGILMMVLADQVSSFLKKNRKYEVLGLFILLIVGVVLLGEGGHASTLTFFNYHVEPLSKTTFYFSIAVLVLVDVFQTRYQKKLAAERTKRQGTPEPLAVDEQ